MNLRARAAPEDLSILSSILGVSRETITHREVIREVYESGVLHDMLGVPRPQPPEPQLPSHPETNGVEKFDVSEVYPQEDGSDVALSDYSEPGRHRRESNYDDEDESRYRMRSSRPPPAKRRKSEPYQEYVTDDDYDD